MNGAEKALNSISNLFEKIGLDWFVCGNTAFEIAKGEQLGAFHKWIDLGIRCDVGLKDSILAELPALKVHYFEGRPLQVILDAHFLTNIFFFEDQSDFIVEARYNTEINRMKLLCYSREFFSPGKTEIWFGSTKGYCLIENHQYLCTLFGGTYIHRGLNWNWWNDPRNVLWEQFIVEPIFNHR